MWIDSVQDLRLKMGRIRIHLWNNIRAKNKKSPSAWTKQGTLFTKLCFWLCILYDHTSGEILCGLPLVRCPRIHCALQKHAVHAWSDFGLFDRLAVVAEA